jgi:hypothetical protein
VILALECHEARVGNPSRQHQAMLEGHPRVPATVQHECWDGNLRQQFRDVDVPGRVADESPSEAAFRRLAAPRRDQTPAA